MTAQEYKTKKEEVIAKFSADLFKGAFITNPTLNKIVHALVVGEDPYAIIEKLIESQSQLMERLIEVVENTPRYNPVLIHKDLAEKS